MKQQYIIYAAEKITSKYIISVAEPEIVFLVLDNVVYYAQGVQGFSEIMLKFVKIQLTQLNM